MLYYTNESIVCEGGEKWRRAAAFTPHTVPAGRNRANMGFKKLLFQKNCEWVVYVAAVERGGIQNGSPNILENAHPKCLVLTVSSPLELTSETTLGGYLYYSSQHPKSQ